MSHFLRDEACRVLGVPLNTAANAYPGLWRGRKLAERRWWQCALEIDGEFRKPIVNAIRHFVRYESCPPLPDSERCVIALRLRLASRIARSLRSITPSHQRSWFSSNLRSMSYKQLLRWLLIDAWDLFAAEIFDESAYWLDEVGGELFQDSRSSRSGDPQIAKN